MFQTPDKPHTIQLHCIKNHCTEAKTSYVKNKKGGEHLATVTVIVGHLSGS